MPCPNGFDAGAVAGSGDRLERPRRAPGLARSDPRAQFPWYAVVGGLSFLCDLGIFAVLVRFGVPIMAALVIGFVIGTLVNHVLSRALAFTGGRYRRAGEVLRLFAVALVGLGLTAALVAAFMVLGLRAISAKIVATPIVLIWNYLGRRLFVFNPDMPTGTWRLSSRVLDRARYTAPVREGHHDDGTHHD